jgi:hypothetical protein
LISTEKILPFRPPAVAFKSKSWAGASISPLLYQH